MLYRVYDDMSRMTAEDVARMLPLVSGERREKALRYRHLLGQWTTLKSYELLRDLLRETGYEPDDSAWQYNEFGKPSLLSGPEFSISHCRQGVAVAVSERSIGVDMESIRTYNDDLARRVMNEQEMRLIDGSAVVFTQLWTQKEAVLKLRGTGIVDDLKQVLVDAPETLTTWVNEQKGYCVTIAETK